MCLGLFTIHSSAGVLSGVVCLHVDDVVGTGNDRFESKLKKLDELVGFGLMKRQKFDHCGSQYEKHASVEITISMKAYIQNLKTSSQQRKAMSSEASMDACNG